MGEKFVELGVSVFDPDFTLSPEKYLAELYDRSGVLGFHSEGMNFVFRFDEARQVMFSKHCAREPVANPEIAEREARMAQAYPNRAKNFQLAYTYGTPDLQLKKLLRKFIGDIAVQANFTVAEPIYARLARGGRLDNFVSDVATLPLRIMLNTSGLPYTESQLDALYRAGYDFVKALDNFVDETPLADADRAVAYVWDYLKNALEQAASDAPMRLLVEEGERLGISREKMIVNASAFLIISLSNTAGISSVYLLRNLIRFPAVREQLQREPELLSRDNVIIEFLRRDNQVKALSRQVHQDFDLGEFRMMKGESVNLFYPGVNLDPNHWDSPLEIRLDREFSGENNIIFGGAIYMCIGRELGIAFMRALAGGFIANLPDSARVVESEIEVDGDWVSERVITKMPIELDPA